MHNLTLSLALFLSLLPVACGSAGAPSDAAVPVDAPDAQPSADASTPDAAPDPDGKVPIDIDITESVSSDGCTHTIAIALPDWTIVDTARFPGGALRGGTGPMVMGPDGVAMQGAGDDYIDAGERLEITFDPAVFVVTYTLSASSDRNGDGQIEHLAGINLRFPTTIIGTGSVDLVDMGQPFTGVISRVEISGSDAVRIGSLAYSTCDPDATIAP